MSSIPYGRQDINQDDIDSVIAVLQSDFLTQGPVVIQFEKSVANYCSAQYAVAVNSATSALHIACLALGVGNGDIVWTTPITFVASANCALYCGAVIDFVDIDPFTCNMSVGNLAEKLIAAEKVGKLPKVVIPVHLGGQPCDMEGIFELSQQYGFKIIEDASHAIGGKYNQEPIGNCRYSNITVFSFHPVKIITTAEGGMAMTNDTHLAKRMRLLRSHGITRDDQEMTHQSEGPWYYQQIALGYNYRMTDLHAALGLSQMSRLNEFVAKRQEFVKRYDQLLASLPVRSLLQIEGCYSGFHLYVVRLKLSEINKTQRQIFEELRRVGIGVNLHYIPVYHQPYYENLGFKRGYCFEAEQYYAEAISLPLFPSLTIHQQDIVIAALKQALLK
ncbi:UDP-4-amino-4,6-dideoxy-N-acetyl-beta-L-altrosamine transaminase [Polynucleobacter paneuropaeus]|jgi:UDP-4-amino-4,6-dideoxy-N-acetyl-beta-L-altrosamine transaminase|uniref:UDP-4-amino-4, 6-dideoxy-N-acetyl-beta-L-altrosamine transaminase n=1 Tax=Polynucleobacter paneuropaeus TaxID=2527775 RepID=UPI001BFD499B|nr:UDP-4-amino-4,6-dideoxy-N-acetyl-beta-L-altrosamine transaminase [Polynucleobacter paneuropaeus]MBT8633193.1 UDP-4-amino-4,6-dideoxy-N-acetyl-beta-L-altrosamine transaminase [Polynucleobacter paneuropaeus]